MADLEDANVEIHNYFNGEPPTDIARASLIGLVLIARELAEQIEDATHHLGEEMVRANGSLETIAKALESIARAANRTLEP